MGVRKKRGGGSEDKTKHRAAMIDGPFTSYLGHNQRKPLLHPLGAHVFDPKTASLNFSIDKGEAATFKYRVLLISGATSDAEMNHEASAFDGEYR